MNESKLTYLFQVYFNKSATGAEREELMDLLMQSENDEQLKALMTETWQQFTGNKQVFNDRRGIEMLMGILQEYPGNKGLWDKTNQNRIFGSFRVVAAAAILLVIITGFYFWLRNSKPVP